jgi:hypothetical protein
MAVTLRLIVGMTTCYTKECDTAKHYGCLRLIFQYKAPQSLMDAGSAVCWCTVPAEWFLHTCVTHITYLVCMMHEHLT